MQSSQRVENSVFVFGICLGFLFLPPARVEPGSRRTLRVASVIGRQFGVTILEKLLEPQAT